MNRREDSRIFSTALLMSSTNYVLCRARFNYFGSIFWQYIRKDNSALYKQNQPANYLKLRLTQLTAVVSVALLQRNSDSVMLE